MDLYCGKEHGPGIQTKINLNSVLGAFFKTHQHVTPTQVLHIIDVTSTKNSASVRVYMTSQARGGLLYKKDRDVCPRNPKKYQNPACGHGLRVLSPLRGTNSKTTHELMVHSFIDEL